MDNEFFGLILIIGFAAGYFIGLGIRRELK